MIIFKRAPRKTKSFIDCGIDHISKQGVRLLYINISHLCQIIPTNTCLCMYILYIFMYNIASSNVISIEYNNADSYSKKALNQIIKVS